ncbi:TonB family protein [Ralstonia solanacearum species complex bacterium KE056]|uniref:TonB family protein n=1 Tax=Ralstonia solanacearum species complex bacterium KE056 TaxID=3119585 RepID=UPI002FC3484B
MLYRVRPLACIVPFALLLGCTTPQPSAPVVAPLVDIGCTNPQPLYPNEARRMGVQGKVVVSGFVEADGTLSGVRVRQSSGSSMLDGAALQAVLSTKCTPFTDPKTGKATRIAFSKPFDFRVDGLPPPVTPSSAGLPAEIRAYVELVRTKVRSNLLVADDLPDDINTVVKVLLGPGGSVLRTTLQKSSGVKSYDDAVLKAIERSEPLPLPKPGQLGTQTIVLSFRPK